MIKRISKGAHKTRMLAKADVRKALYEAGKSTGFEGVLPAAGKAKRYTDLNRANRRKLESASYRKAMKAKIAEAASAVEPMLAAA